MSPHRRAVAYLNMGLEPEQVFEQLLMRGLGRAAARAVLAVAWQSVKAQVARVSRVELDPH